MNAQQAEHYGVNAQQAEHYVQAEDLLAEARKRRLQLEENMRTGMVPLGEATVALQLIAATAAEAQTHATLAGAL